MSQVTALDLNTFTISGIDGLHKFKDVTIFYFPNIDAANFQSFLYIVSLRYTLNHSSVFAFILITFNCASVFYLIGFTWLYVGTYPTLRISPFPPTSYFQYLQFSKGSQQTEFPSLLRPLSLVFLGVIDTLCCFFPLKKNQLVPSIHPERMMNEKKWEGIQTLCSSIYIKGKVGKRM